jgi:L-alanine-DL-glutamate epimerase-like enolase superfamily enzyme
MGMADLPTIDADGFIAGPTKPGLGYDIDHDAVDNLTLQRM